MNVAPKCRRRFQFRLRTLLLITTAVSVFCGSVSTLVWPGGILLERQYALQGVPTEAFLITLSTHDPQVPRFVSTSDLPWFRRKILGDEALSAMLLPPGVSPENPAIARLRRAFPEAKVIRV